MISPCVTYWDTYPKWEQALHDVDADPEYDPSDRVGAFAATTQLAVEGRLPAGLIYRAPEATTAAALAPASAVIDPVELRTRYAAMLDEYSFAGT